MLRIITANLNGIRSAARKGFFPWLASQNADVVCTQELKAQAVDLDTAMRQPDGLEGWFHHAQKKGYSGVGLYSRQTPERVIEGLGIADIDAEGRYLQLDFPTLSVVSLYLPSGSSSPERQAAKFSFMARFLPHLTALASSGREVVIGGDWNIAHREIDLKNWKSNQKNSGFLPEERQWLSQVLTEAGWVDVYRTLYPEAGDESYTWWSNRGQAWAKNVGWRIDYQLATPKLAARALRASVYKAQRFSDHAPLSIDYDISL
ncbi:exodeoxyribonuclease III [Betaproteobacteria bacterium]|nr:exodeoxyribonuclease III [Betaproteobacteria bacterium]GHU02177.1 exodeoxyribonuclease III [Betaproteobacteria bacterium]GHU23787.1 exodeoxyribonuclease III [Betaproteobacteria bacterium]